MDMLEASDQPDYEAQQAKLSELRERLNALEAENARLQARNRDLRRTLDAHIARARSTALFGSVEMTAGTCVGPRRSKP